MVGLGQDEKYVYLFMEYVQGGELFLYLRDQVNLGHQQAAFYCAQVVTILEHLH